MNLYYTYWNTKSLEHIQTNIDIDRKIHMCVNVVKKITHKFKQTFYVHKSNTHTCTNKISHTHIYIFPFTHLHRATVWYRNKYIHICNMYTHTYAYTFRKYIYLYTYTYFSRYRSMHANASFKTWRCLTINTWLHLSKLMMFMYVHAHTYVNVHLYEYIYIYINAKMSYTWFILKHACISICAHA